jgi:mRNA interferase MazF
VIRGAVHRLALSRGASGHEQRGRRFGVVDQADELLGLSTVLIAPTSTQARPATFRPLIEIDGEATRVMVEQRRAIDPMRLGEQVHVLRLDELRQVEAAMELVLGL